MNTCDKCKYWTKMAWGTCDSENAGFTVRECQHPKIEFQGPYYPEGAGYHDVEGYGGRFVTGPKFGCLLFEYVAV
jgi:hypothetical protein